MVLYKAALLLGAVICTGGLLEPDWIQNNFDVTCVFGMVSFKGTTAVTWSGKTCQNWSSQSPNEHTITPESYPEGGLDSNYCRNPNKSKWPFCVTTDPDTRWEYCHIPSCQYTFEDLFCASGNGSKYKGEISQTWSGKTCQNWSAQSPHKHTFTPQNYSSSFLEGNLCRNPNNSTWPWCYTTDPDTRWEYCLVPNCEDSPGADLPCALGNGKEYRGEVAVTWSGKTCQNWSAQFPHEHTFTPQNNPKNGLKNNYCRNPNNSTWPWCYTTDPDTRWEYCPVERCEDSPGTGADLPCTSGNGKEYRGQIAVTWSGKTCQDWLAQIPHKHTVTPQNNPKSGLASNFCRNPNNSTWPWCYTTDPDTPWEYCPVQSCEDLPGHGAELFCTSGKGKAYRGTIAETLSGKTCQSWSSQSPHKHTTTPQTFPKGGLESNYCRNPNDADRPWCYTTDPDTRWEYCRVPNCEDSPEAELNCTSGQGKAYRGAIAKTWSGKTCQHWSAQSPHKHTVTPQNYPNSGLKNNYCRNPNNSKWPWCYTTNPDTPWEYCPVPNCEDSPGAALNCTFGTGQMYRGTISVTWSGITCQSWSVQTPQKHKYTPQKYLNSGLESNYCRNPDDGTERPWCYTTDPDTRWEYCRVPRCGGSFTTELNCTFGTGTEYRGTISVTSSGKTCQSWVAQSPHWHNYTPQKYLKSGLESNYCRNPDDDAERPWCFTTDPDTRWEYCHIPNCGNSLGIEVTCTFGNGQDYRGTVAVTKSGKPCQRWASKVPHMHTRSPSNYPKSGLESNFCRNPDDSAHPWCYTVDQNIRWEYCDVPKCEDSVTAELNCTHGDGTAYRGAIAVTSSGKTCQMWSSQKPHSHSHIPQNYPTEGLESNYCRNPDGKPRAWCYTTDTNTRWEYCRVPRCGK